MGRTVVVVVDVVVVVVVVDVDVLPKISEISIDWTPCCSKTLSMDRGVVETVGQPVNSVVALMKYNKLECVRMQQTLYGDGVIT